MLRTIFDELKAGNRHVADAFAELEVLWSAELAGIAEMSDDDLAEKLSALQSKVEKICGSRNLGKAIMPWSAHAHLYSAKMGYEDNGPQAAKLARAFQKTTCSSEVKSGAKDAAEVYSVADFE